MKKKFIFPVLLIMIAACNSNQPPASQADSTLSNTGTDTVTTATPAPPVAGTYQGTLPCADCPGMDYQLSLYSNHSFSELVAYRGRGQGIASVDTGHWKQATDSTVILEKKKDSSSFLLAEGKLLVLDAKGNRIGGVLASNYVLKPVEGGDRRALLAEKAKASIRFTANGNEPGWTLDLDKKKIYFHTMNNDSLQVSLPAARPNTDTLKVYTTKDITVSIRNTMCIDDMSGLMRPNTVQVQVKDKTYQGCGEYITQSSKGN